MTASRKALDQWVRGFAPQDADRLAKLEDFFNWLFLIIDLTDSPNFPPDRLKAIPVEVIRHAWKETFGEKR